MFVRSFLERHLPDTLGVTRGIIVDGQGQATDERDVILIDRRAPRFPLDGSFSLVPAESALATVEIKSTAKTDALRDALKQLKKVKLLSLIRDENQGVKITYPKIEGKPPTTIVFFVKADDSQFLSKAVDWLLQNNPDRIIDMVAVVGQGYILSKDAPVLLDWGAKYLKIEGRGTWLAGVSLALNRPPRSTPLPRDYFFWEVPERPLLQDTKPYQLCKELTDMELPPDASLKIVESLIAQMAKEYPEQKKLLADLSALTKRVLNKRKATEGKQ